jgi:hypothetical protein
LTVPVLAAGHGDAGALSSARIMNQAPTLDEILGLERVEFRSYLKDRFIKPNYIRESCKIMVASALTVFEVGVLRMSVRGIH